MLPPHINPYHVDALDRPIEVGDIVLTTFGGYGNLLKMKVVGFTPKKIRIQNITGKSFGSSSGRRGWVPVDGVTLGESSHIVIVKTHDGRELEFPED